MKTMIIVMHALLTMPLIALKSHSFNIKLRIVILYPPNFMNFSDIKKHWNKLYFCTLNHLPDRIIYDLNKEDLEISCLQIIVISDFSVAFRLS